MPRAKQPRGKCAFCGHDTTKSAMAKHHAACPARTAQIADAAKSKRKPQSLIHLRIEPTVRSPFWLDVEIRGNATLEDLDEYLRAIWLECCGHMRQFSIGGWSGDEIPMRRRIESVFENDVELTHIYDFGDSSETLIRSIDRRRGVPLTKWPIMLMARNHPPDDVCIECEEPATYYCPECLIEDNVFGALCEKHAKDHPHQDYGEPVPLVNSPRLGLCGYTGPADPPY